jgi:hypothetical protein
MDVSRCQSDFLCPTELAEWAEWLSAGLHGRNRWRLVVVLSGMLFAQGRRTVTTWLRGAGVCTDYKAYYYFLGSVGRNTQRIADQLLWWIFRKVSLDESQKGHVLFAIDDSPTKRYGPEVEGAGIHHNPTPGPAEQKYVYGHVWVTLALIARHPSWGAIGLPLLSKLYVRRKNFPRVPKTWSFQTKLEQAAEMVEWLALWMRFFGQSLLIVVDGAYAKRPFLKRAMAEGAVVISRLRSDAALFELPQKPKPHQRGRKPKYGKRRIRLSRRATSRRGWKTIPCAVYGREETVTYKTFLATWKPAGGVIRVVLVRWKSESGQMTTTAYFATDPTLSVQAIVEAVADRSAIEQVFHDVKEVWGAGQQQVRHIYASIACWHMNLWLHTLVELWAWNKPEEELVNRSASPWDKAGRRPSHADKKRAWQRQTLAAEFRTLAGLFPMMEKIQHWLHRLTQIAL